MIDMDAARGSDSDTAAASPLRRSDILIAVDQRGRGGSGRGGPAFSRGGPAFSAGLSRDERRTRGDAVRSCDDVRELRAS